MFKFKNLLVFAGVALEQWSIVQCNNQDTGAPEMTAAFQKDYYEENVAELNLNFVFNSQVAFEIK